MRTLLCLVASLSLLFSSLSFAQQKESFGDYDIHYAVFNSTFITPEVAKAYQLRRSSTVHLLNISVRKKNADGSDSEHPAQVKGTINDLMRVDPLEFREIRENGAIYYLAEFPVQYQQNLIFDLEVTPEGAGTHTFSFRKYLYPDHQ